MTKNQFRALKPGDKIIVSRLTRISYGQVLTFVKFYDRSNASMDNGIYYPAKDIERVEA